MATKGGYHINQLDKVSDPVIGQSIATAYPNGVMGTLSLLAGVVWYLVNKSATPVVKMRSGHGGTDSDVNTFGTAFPCLFTSVLTLGAVTYCSKSLILRKDLCQGQSGPVT